MKVICPATHAALDYLIGFLLIVAPWLFGFAAISAEATYLMLFLGLGMLLLSILTQYPLGIIEAIPFPVHGVIETLFALGLLGSPWVLGFSDIESARIAAIVLASIHLGVVVLSAFDAEAESIHDRAHHYQ